MRYGSTDIDRDSCDSEFGDESKDSDLSLKEEKTGRKVKSGGHFIIYLTCHCLSKGTMEKGKDRRKNGNEEKYGTADVNKKGIQKKRKRIERTDSNW